MPVRSTKRYWIPAHRTQKMDTRGCLPLVSIISRTIRSNRLPRRSTSVPQSWQLKVVARLDALLLVSVLLSVVMRDGSRADSRQHRMPMEDAMLAVLRECIGSYACSGRGCSGMTVHPASMMGRLCSCGEWASQCKEPKAYGRRPGFDFAGHYALCVTHFLISLVLRLFLPLRKKTVLLWSLFLTIYWIGGGS